MSVIILEALRELGGFVIFVGILAFCLGAAHVIERCRDRFKN